MTTIEVDYGWCTETRPGDGWRPDPCGRKANGEDKLCTPHRVGKRRRQENMARWDAESKARNEQYRRERAQEAFVRQWREQHPDEVFDDGWRCPLCNQVVQRFSTAYPSEHEAHVQRWIKYHQDDHGASWTAYLEAGGLEA